MADHTQKQWLEVPDLARALELDERLVRQFIADGLLPSPVVLSQRKSAYHHSELETIIWIIKHKARFKGRGDTTESVLPE